MRIKRVKRVKRKVDAARHSDDLTIDGIGFDPGSSNSAVAFHQPGDCSKLLKVRNEPTFPSTLQYDATTDTVEVGLYSPDTSPEQRFLISEHKRLIGRNAYEHTFLEDLKTGVGRFVAVLSGVFRLGGADRNFAVSTGHGDKEGSYDKDLRGIKLKRMLRTAEQLLLPTSAGLQADPYSFFPTAEAENAAMNKGLGHLFRSMLADAATSDLAAGKSDTAVVTDGRESTEIEELAMEVKATYGESVDYSDIRRRVLKMFDIMAATILGHGQLVDPVLATASLLKMAKDQVQAIYEPIKFCGPASTAGGDSIEVAGDRYVRVRPVIAVPAQFTNSQRKDTLVAAELVGLEDTRLVTEPAAALVAIAMGGAMPCPDGRYMIADLGNGTFDCAVADIQTETGAGGAKKIATVVATAGDNRLGGANLTNIVENMVINQLVDKVESQVLEELRQSNDLRKTAETVKKHLCSQQPYKCTVAKQVVVIRRDDFLVQAKDVYERIGDIVRKLKAEPEVRGSKIRIRKCFLVGAASLTHGFREAVADSASVDVLLSPDPKSCVAEGAAYVSAGVAELTETLPRSIGIAAHTSELQLSIILKRHSHYPATGSKTYTTTQDNQSCLEIAIYEGEDYMLEHNVHLATYDIDGLTPLPKGQLEMEVSMKVSKSGTLTVTAEEVRGSQQEDAARRQLKVTERGNVAPQQRSELEEQYQKFFGDGERPNQPLTKRPKI